MRGRTALLLAVLLAIFLWACQPQQPAAETTTVTATVAVVTSRTVILETPGGELALTSTVNLPLILPQNSASVTYSGTTLIGLQRLTEINILVAYPYNNALVLGPFVPVSGYARTFENNYLIRLWKGTEVHEYGAFIAQGGEMGTFSAFAQVIQVPQEWQTATAVDLVLEVYTHSPKDGSEIDNVKVPFTVVF
ncbi:hypothetical protein HPY42_01930 [Coprothermobacteraceae bacterium]|nr:hypothetical protein [Coprothermobacteraceae bacterium]